jgi:hypothetical protein
MAHIFRKPGKKAWWACYYVDDKRVRHSLRTTDERIVLARGSSGIAGVGFMQGGLPSGSRRHHFI